MKIVSLEIERDAQDSRRIARELVLVALIAGWTSACVADVDPETALAAGSSGSSTSVASNTGAAGAASAGAQAPAGNTGSNVVNNVGGSGGAAPYTSDPEFGAGVPCAPAMQALLTDFTPVVAAGADAGVAGAAPVAGASFGDFTTTFSGSTFVYPGEGAYAVLSDVSAGSWHLTGTLGNYSGFGLSFANCYLVDASAYKGISFTVQGSVPMGNSITFNVGTAADDISNVWLNERTNPETRLPPNAGRCLPAMAQYDSTCASPNRTVPVGAAPATISVLWAELVGGRPAPTVDPKEITNISWNFPPPAGAGSTTPVTYDVDITIDDLRFIE